MSDMFDSLQDEMAGLRRELEAVKAERDALAAHVELGSRIVHEWRLGAFGDVAAAQQLGEWLHTAPTTSIARLKAQWQAEAVEAMCIEIQPLSHRCASILASKAGELRRQAEADQ